MSVRGGNKLAGVLNRISNKIGAGRKTVVRAGFLADATYPDGKSVAMVAAIQDGGAPSKGIPPRPFFRKAIAEHGPQWPVQLAKVLKYNNFDAQKSLGQMGELIVGQIEQSIVDTNLPPNSPVTNLLKQRFPMGGQTFDDVLQARADVKAGATAPAGKPLVQSGHLLGSVDKEVVVR